MLIALERVHPDDLGIVREMVENGAHGKDLDYEHRLLMPDGSVKRVHVLGRALNPGTAKLEFVGAMMDITTVKNAFEEIRSLRDQLYKENVALREEIDITRMFDLYEMYDGCQTGPPNLHVVIRAQHNRQLEGHGELWAFKAAQPVGERRKLTCPAAALSRRGRQRWRFAGLRSPSNLRPSDRRRIGRR
jgi:hypothetical protein